VKRQYRSGTADVAASIAVSQIKTLVTSLSRGVQLLDSEIVTEEERTQCRDQRNPAYSVLARSLIARRDNLCATITALQEQSVLMETSTMPRAVRDELLLPA
jgi:hypothetical protein